MMQDLRHKVKVRGKDLAFSDVSEYNKRRISAGKEEHRSERFNGEHSKQSE